jgi:hypothetical protein
VLASENFFKEIPTEGSCFAEVGSTLICFAKCQLRSVHGCFTRSRRSTHSWPWARVLGIKCGKLLLIC